MKGLTSRGIALSAMMMSPSRPRRSLQLTLTYKQDSPCSTTTPELTGAPSGACQTASYTDRVTQSQAYRDGTKLRLQLWYIAAMLHHMRLLLRLKPCMDST